MNLWRGDDEVGVRPQVLGGRNLALALGIHLAVFLVFFAYAAVKGLFDKKEEIIPIDLTVVVNENLNGVENEPPPVKNPPPPEKKVSPPKPPPKPEVKKKPDPPKELEKIVTNIVEKVEKKPPEKPKKTAAQLRQEKIDRIRKAGKVTNKPVKIEVKTAVESGNGRTERQTRSPEEIMALLNKGYRPGTKTQIAPNMMSHCISLVQRALDDKWQQMSPTVGMSGTVVLSAKFSSNGGLVGVRIVKSCGDRTSDAAALSVARNVSYIQGLDPEFLARFRSEPLTINYRVQGQ